MLDSRKIYIKDKVIVLTEKAENYLSLQPNDASFLLLKGNDSSIIRIAKKHLDNQENKGVIIQDINMISLYKNFSKDYVKVKAGGGVVINPKGEILLIFRKNKWDLPKGKREKNEDNETCALREVNEETGVINLELVQPLIKTYHTYNDYGENALKTTHWFLMKVKEEQTLIPQLEEDISIAKWVPQAELAECMNNSYATIKDVLKAANLI